MLPESLALEVVTPDRAVVRESVAEVQLPGREGYLGILPGHTPLLTELGTGVLTYRQGSQTRRVAVSGGLAEVLPDRVIVLADLAERSEEIDVPRARTALANAERQLAASGADWEVAQQAANRARTRLEAAAPGSAVAHAAEVHAAH